MARPYKPPTLPGTDRRQGKQIDRLQRERTDVPAYLDDLNAVTAFRMAHRQSLTFNKFTGLWAPLNPMDLPYGFMDPPTIGTTFAFTFRDDYNVVGGSLCVTTTGSSSTIVSFKKNGTNFLTLTLGSGASIVTATVSPVGFAANSDILTVSLSTIGTGALGIGGGLRLN